MTAHTHTSSAPAARVALAAALLGAGVVAGARAATAQATTPPAASRRADPGAAVAREDALLGTWAGTYRGPLYDRSGRLVLRLARDGRALRGTLRLTGLPREAALGQVQPEAPARGEPGDSVDLALDSVHVTAATDADARPGLTAWAAPYADPRCGCAVALRFDARLRGDTLEGRWANVTETVMATDRRGRWQAARTFAR